MTGEMQELEPRGDSIADQLTREEGWLPEGLDGTPPWLDPTHKMPYGDAQHPDVLTGEGLD